MIRWSLAFAGLYVGLLFLPAAVPAADEKAPAKGVKIVNVATGKVLGIIDDSDEDAAQTCLAKDENKLARRWRIEGDGGFLKITNVGTSKVLDVYGDIADEENPIIQWPAKDEGTDNQRWSWDGTGNDRRLKSKFSQLVLDVAGDGNIVQRKADPKSKSQLWRVVDPNFVRLVHVATGKVLGVNGDSDDNEAQAMVVADETKDQAKSRARQWKIVVDGNSLKLVNRKSGKALDVSGESLDEGGIIIQYEEKSADEGNANQRWSWVGEGNERRLRSKSSSLVLDVDRDGSVIQRSADGRTKSQLWRVVDVDE